jgi:hypothetical protein
VPAKIRSSSENLARPDRLGLPVETVSLDLLVSRALLANQGLRVRLVRRGSRELSDRQVRRDHKANLDPKVRRVLPVQCVLWAML